jgi:predicted AAA+ superfamily ATPase
MYLKRVIEKEVLAMSNDYPVVTITGPRQSGKTTLAQMTFPDMEYYSLEDPDIRLAAEADPRNFLEQSGSAVILDEVQRLPLLLSYIQGIVDRAGKPGQFILTGSHQPRLHEAISQSLAGRSAMLTLWRLSRKHGTDNALICEKLVTFEGISGKIFCKIN